MMHVPLCMLKSDQLRQLWLSQSDSHHWRYYHRQAFRNNYKCLLWFVTKAKVKLKVWLHIYIIARPIKLKLLKISAALQGLRSFFRKKWQGFSVASCKYSENGKVKLTGSMYIYIILGKWWYHYASWNQTG